MDEAAALHACHFSPALVCGADINLLGSSLMHLEIKSKRVVLTMRSELVFLYGIEMLDASPLPTKKSPFL